VFLQAQSLNFMNKGCKNKTGNTVAHKVPHKITKGVFCSLFSSIADDFLMSLNRNALDKKRKSHAYNFEFDRICKSIYGIHGKIYT
jgi:hypothetical protein